MDQNRTGVHAGIIYSRYPSARSGLWLATTTVCIALRVYAIVLARAVVRPCVEDRRILPRIVLVPHAQVRESRSDRCHPTCTTRRTYQATMENCHDPVRVRTPIASLQARTQVTVLVQPREETFAAVATILRRAQVVTVSVGLAEGSMVVIQRRNVEVLVVVDVVNETMRILYLGSSNLHDREDLCLRFRCSMFLPHQSRPLLTFKGRGEYVS